MTKSALGPSFDYLVEEGEADGGNLEKMLPMFLGSEECPAVGGSLSLGFELCRIMASSKCIQVVLLIVVKIK
jgi:hypothetical protein